MKGGGKVEGLNIETRSGPNSSCSEIHTAQVTPRNGYTLVAGTPRRWLARPHEERLQNESIAKHRHRVRGARVMPLPAKLRH